jgi:hypothetical protein
VQLLPIVLGHVDYIIEALGEKVASPLHNYLLAVHLNAPSFREYGLGTSWISGNDFLHSSIYARDLKHGRLPEDCPLHRHFALLASSVPVPPRDEASISLGKMKEFNAGKRNVVSRRIRGVRFRPGERTKPHAL